MHLEFLGFDFCLEFLSDFSGKDFNDLQFLKASFPIFADGFKDTLFNCSQFSKTDSPMIITESGIINSVKEVQFLKAQSDIQLHLHGFSKETFFNAEQPSKAKTSIEVTDEGIEISFKAVQPSNKDRGM